MDRPPFHSLSAERKRNALGVAARLGGPRAYLLEKDIWVVQTLSALFRAPFGQDLVFKGGTSESFEDVMNRCAEIEARANAR